MTKDTIKTNEPVRLHSLHNFPVTKGIIDAMLTIQDFDKAVEFIRWWLDKDYSVRNGTVGTKHVYENGKHLKIFAEWQECFGWTWDVYLMPQ